eukprot:GSChrysophyteH1.ASY1.ANO1.2763.1 assembled CDS
MNFFTTNPTITFKFSDAENRARKFVKVQGGESEWQLVYLGSESVRGTIEIATPNGKKIEHQGIKVERIGQIEMIGDRLSSPTKFTQLVKLLDSAGSYSGMNVRLRYFLKVTVSRKYNNYSREVDFAIENPQKVTDAVPHQNSSHLVNNSAMSNPIKMEVGIEECLHIEFEYDRDRYHLKDVILGKIYFLLVRIKIKHMELAVIKRESAGVSQSSTYTDSENITKYELMDGAPIKGECVPIRLFLEPLDLTPTYRSVRNIFSVKYYLNLVLVDEEDRRYFKQNEITFVRQVEESAGAGNKKEEPAERQL